MQTKRIALLSNRAATDRRGRPIADQMAADPGCRLCCIYSPEHGFALNAEAGAHVLSANDGSVPVISLYGDRSQPSATELADIDLFMIDLPDIGVRYFTYMATMKDCLEACAANGVPVSVLDRPNPLGGMVLEGPLPTVYGADVCCAPIPIRHGMTLGELALFFKTIFFADAGLRLDVVPADHWWRAPVVDVGDVLWTAPSPNLPAAANALMYVGTCLFEGLNLNEGRGTDTPFLLCGAPWLNPAAVLATVTEVEHPGIELTPTTYRPRSIPGKAASPAYCNVECQGIAIRIVDPHVARPLTTALALISGIYRHHSELEWKPGFDTLAGGPHIRERIQLGMPVLDLVSAWTSELKRFDDCRPHLYSVARAEGCE